MTLLLGEINTYPLVLALEEEVYLLVTSPIHIERDVS